MPATPASRLGLKTSFVTNVGDDKEGLSMIRALQKKRLTPVWSASTLAKSATCTKLWYKEERTILINHENYKYYWPHLRPDEIPRWVYFSSISENALEYHDQSF